MDKIIDTLYKLYNLYLQYIHRVVRDKGVLKENKKFKNSFHNKRCFILGNGPSLKEEDLSCLENEIVFTVNQISRNNQFEKILPTFHFWIDKNFFDIDINKEEDVELLRTMIEVRDKESKPFCFYPLNQKAFVEKYNLNNGKERYLDVRLILNSIYPLKIDISKYTYSVGTVVQQAIMTAMYMGFSEIYLLGCDSTGIVTTINSALHKENDTYSYVVSENEKKRMETMVKKSRISDYAYSYYMTLKGFDILYNNCCSRGIKLVNCSKSTVLDTIPRMSLSEVLK